MAGLTEKAWQAKVVEAAKWRRWNVYHTYDSRRSEPGFPDLVLVRGARLMFVELKTDKGRMTEAQLLWHARLGACADVHVWRPSMWDEVDRLLA